MWGLVDCDNFFCSCERVFRPDLERVPMVVLSNNDGCVVARSAEAKSMGVKMGIPYYQMLEQFGSSGIVAFSSNYTLYADMSARVMSIIRDSVPEMLQYSIDESFINLEGFNPPDIHEWGVELSQKIRKWTGIPVSIGIASTKTLAKVAGRYAKKFKGYHKCCVIAGEDARRKALEGLETGEIWGIGRRLSVRLLYDGVRTALDFAGKPREWVRRKYHVTGERTWRELNGENVVEIEGLETAKKSILTSRSFPGMLTEYKDVETHVANFATRCAEKLRSQRSACSLLNVFVESNRFREDLEQYGITGAYTFTTPVCSTQEIVAGALKVLREIFRPGIFYKRAGVMVSQFTSGSVIQPDLFYYDSEKSLKFRSISEAIDEINRHLGRDTVILASQQYAAKGEDGKSLKFVNAIRRSLKSPDYSTMLSDFRIN